MACAANTDQRELPRYVVHDYGQHWPCFIHTACLSWSLPASWSTASFSPTVGVHVCICGDRVQPPEAFQHKLLRLC